MAKNEVIGNCYEMAIGTALIVVCVRGHVCTPVYSLTNEHTLRYRDYCVSSDLKPSLLDERDTVAGSQNFGRDTCSPHTTANICSAEFSLSSWILNSIGLPLSVEARAANERTSYLNSQMRTEHNVEDKRSRKLCLSLS